MTNRQKAGMRTEAKAKTRAFILKTARELWDEPGSYERITVRIIAKWAGRSTSAIFAHWPGKEDLWREAMGYEPPVDSAVVRQALRRDAHAQGAIQSALQEAAS